MEPTKINANHRVSCTNCCVVGCHNNYSNTHKSVKFYSFPSKPHEHQRRIQWINAVKRNCYNEKKKVWEPKPYSRVCSQHFIGNAKSNHPNHPAFIPTIFPKVDKKNVNRNVGNKTKRFERLLKRNVIKKQFSLESSVPSTSQQAVREGEKYNDNNIATSCNTPLSNPLKTYVDKCIGSNHGSDECAAFHGFSSIKTDDQIVSLTGVNFKVFNHILSLLCNLTHGNEKNSIEDKLLIFLIKMKLGISYSAVGVLFGIHRSTAQRIFILILEELVQKMKNYVFWPSKEIVLRTMPEVFKLKYPNCRVIIDCSEIKIQQPGPIDHRRSSRYKGTFTAKFLIGITPCGFISFISDCYGGRSSDNFITNSCGILKLLEKGDLCLADKGFPGVKCEDVIIVMPPFLHDGQLTEEVEDTYSVASLRIHVERAIQRLKTYNILNHFTNKMLSNLDQIIFMCCVLANLQAPIIKNDNNE